MRTELRFFLAIVLMVGVLVVTNLIFPPAVPDGAPPEGPSAGSAELVLPPGMRGEPETPVAGGTLPGVEGGGGVEEAVVEERTVTVEGPRYRYRFSTLGARIESAELLRFTSFTTGGPVTLVEEGVGGLLVGRVVSGRDTLDLGRLQFEVEPADGLLLSEGGSPQALTFRNVDALGRVRVEVSYTFSPDDYLVGVSGTVAGGGTVLLTGLGTGIPLHENVEREEVRSRAYVTHQVREGIRSKELGKVSESEVTEGPLHWGALRNRYFVVAMLGPELPEGGTGVLGGAVASPLPADGQVSFAVAQPLGGNGGFGYRLYLGPQDYSRLKALGNEFQEVNAYGWRFIRPLLRPFVGITTTVLVWLHEQLNLGYGWVLAIFGIMMRVLLWPLNQRAMRAQFRNMAVQPLLQDAQKKYKDNPERMQKELMKLYKEHGFNPLAGCLPLLLPWPILIALFFVFQNTIELRGVPFLWLPDLSAPDPLYILPIFLGLSMFLLQWVSFRSMDEVNPQMKFMLWFMPIFMVFIFFQFASGLNLYYAVSNVATIPQQWWIARERKKVKVKTVAPTSG